MSRFLALVLSMIVAVGCASTPNVPSTTNPTTSASSEPEPPADPTPTPAVSASPEPEPPAKPTPTPAVSVTAGNPRPDIGDCATPAHYDANFGVDVHATAEEGLTELVTDPGAFTRAVSEDDRIMFEATSGQAMRIYFGPIDGGWSLAYAEGCTGAHGM